MHEIKITARNMKKISLIIACIVVQAVFFNRCNSTEGNTAANGITFYDVPLVCGAYAEIGCGSRAKPALMDMEKNPGVKEAWLNRTGTVIARHIAGTLSTFALDRKLITQQEADILIPKVEEYFKAELVKIRTPEQLIEDSGTKFSNDLVAMSESVLGKERTQNILAQWSGYKMEECKKNAASCSGKSKDACCKKK